MIDLHIHTNHSDGVFSTLEILKMVEAKKIKTISICDHNVLGAYDDLNLINVKDYYSGTIIPGIELDFVYEQKIFHMLGYNFDVEKLKKSKLIDRRGPEELIEEQRNHLEFLKGVCAKLNIKLSPNLRIDTPNQQANDIIKTDMLTHEENKDVLDQLLGKDRKISFWRGHVTNPNSPFYIDFTKGLPTAIEVAKEIHDAGGLVVLPHPFEYTTIDNKKFLNEMYDLNILDGVECVHTKHNLKQVQFLENYCKENHLLMSGGSDFHDSRYELGKTKTGIIEDKYCLKY